MAVDTAVATQTAPVVNRPSAGLWEVDPTHSTVGFVARHMMVAKVRGHFSHFSGTVNIGERLEDSKIDVTIHADSIDTNVGARDGHLKSADFLNAEEFPHITFTGSEIEHDGKSSGKLTGDLTIRNVTRPVTLDISFEGEWKDPWGGTHAGFTAAGEIDREAFGVTYNMALEAGGVMVGKMVRLELDVELLDAVAAANAKAAAS